MDLTHLRYFQAIASSGSMTAAAKALHVSQPTLTVAMQNLEERLKTQLLLRERSGVRLTVTGEELLKHAQEIFHMLDVAEERVKGLESGDEGTFVIGCHESLGAYFLPTFMARFLRAHPKIELLISNESSASVLPPSKTDPAFEAARHRLLAGPLIYAGRVPQCRELTDQLAARGLLSVRSLVCGDLELVKSLALAGIGPALLPRRVGAYGHEGSLVRLHPDLPFIPDTICLLYRADMHRTKAAMKVKDELVAFGRGLDS